MGPIIILLYNSLNAGKPVPQNISIVCRNDWWFYVASFHCVNNWEDSERNLFEILKSLILNYFSTW